MLIEKQNEDERRVEEKPTVYLLEFDRRFEVFSEFVYYDFNKPFSLPRKSYLHHTAHINS